MVDIGMDLFDRTKAAAEALLAIHSRETTKYELKFNMLDLIIECREADERTHFSSAQLDELKRIALEYLGRGVEPLGLAAIMAFGGASDYKHEVPCPFKIEPIFKVDTFHPHNIIISLLDDIGVFEAGEYPVYRDFGRLSLFEPNNVSRSGVIVITNRRVLVVGSIWTTPKSKKYRILYNEWAKMPYIDAIDFVSYQDLGDIKLRTESISAEWSGEYLESKKEVFYGPYFFKFDLPKSVKRKKGKINLFISPHDFGNSDVFDRVKELSRQIGLLIGSI